MFYVYIVCILLHCHGAMVPLSKCSLHGALISLSAFAPGFHLSTLPYQPKFNSIHLQRMICCPDVSPLKVMSTRWMLDAAETSTLTHDMQKLLQQLNLSREDVLVFCVYVKMLNATPRHGVINQNWPR